METTYLYYPKKKIYHILISELPKRGYEIVGGNYSNHTIEIEKKTSFFRRRIPLLIELEDSTSTITIIHCTDRNRHNERRKHAPELVKDILHIF